MAVSVTMPRLGESVSEGVVTRWLKREGERVEADEPLFEVSTDKVDTEIPSPHAGVLRRILVPEGETVAVGAPVAIVAPAGEEVELPVPSESASAPAAVPARNRGSPVVARIAAEHGLDLTAIEGSGRGGRVTKRDVVAFLAAPPAEPAPAAPAPPVSGEVRTAETREAMSAMRRAIA